MNKEMTATRGNERDGRKIPCRLYLRKLCWYAMTKCVCDFVIKVGMLMQCI